MTKAVLPLALLFALGSAAQARPKRHHRPRPHVEESAPAPQPTPAPEAAPADAGSAQPAPAPEAAPTQPAPAAESAPAQPSSGAASVDLDSLNAEYNAIRDELFRSRAKVQLLGSALYKTRLSVTFQYHAERAWPLKRVTLELDDQPVYGADAPQATDQPLKIYEGFAAPGRHTLTVRVECGATGSGRLGYATEDSFTFDAADGREAHVELDADENGSGPEPIAKKHSGSFAVELKAQIDSQELSRK